MLQPSMAQVTAVEQAEEHARQAHQPGLDDFRGGGPARRAVGGDAARLARAPHRHADGHRHQAAGPGNGAALGEDVRRVGVKEKPPLEQAPGVVDRRAEEIEPGRTKA